MIVLNFSHPLTLAQWSGVRKYTKQPVTDEKFVKLLLDEQQPIAPQLTALVEQIGLTPEQWQSRPILVVLPESSFVVPALLAELHGRMGYFPPVVRPRLVPGNLPIHYEVAEILNPEALRRKERRRQQGNEGKK